MKRSIYISGIACAILMLLGAMFKINHWPGAAPLLIAAVFTFCFLFLPMALMASYRSQEEKKFKALHIVTYIVFSITLMGALFKVLHWPGAGMFLIIGIPLPFVLFLPVYLYQTREEKKTSNLNFLGIMFGLTFLAIFSVLLALNVSRFILEAAAANVSNIDNSTFFLETKLKDNEIEKNVAQKADELCSYIDVLKNELLLATGNAPYEQNTRTTYVTKEINLKDARDIPMQILFGDENKMQILKGKIKEYHNALLSSGKMSSELTELVNVLFNVGNTEYFTPYGDKIELSWEQRGFINYQLIFLLNTLSELQNNARLVEGELLVSAK